MRDLAPRTRRELVEFALAAVASAAFVLAWGDLPVWDDAGFVLRYLDQFAAGHFYHFNAEDGPVFGLSSFLHGVLAGTLAWSRLLDPHAAMLASNFVGLTLLSWALLRLFAAQGAAWWLAILAWLAAIASSPRLVINLAQGLETPLHAGVTVSALLALTVGRMRTAHAFAALAVVSKLDLAPAALLLALAASVAHARGAGEGATGRAVRSFLLWFAVPVGIFVAFTTLYFGSPLPQSAAAKLHLHARGQGGWFPFLAGFSQSTRTILLGVALLVVHLVVRVTRRRPDSIALYAPTAVLLAVLALYWYYNPGEQMGWYYAVPDLLIALQIALLALALGRTREGRVRPAVPIALLSILVAASIPLTLEHVRHTRWYLRTCEAERIAIGEWIGARAAATDTLLTAYGHIGRTSGLYVLDASGLNSEAATDLRLDFGRLVTTYRPQWLAKLELLDNPTARTGGYRLVNSWYDVPALIEHPAQRVYRRVGGDSVQVTLPLPVEAIVTDGDVDANPGATMVRARGTRWSLTAPHTEDRAQALVMGVQRASTAFTLRAEGIDAIDGTKVSETLHVPALDPRFVDHAQTVQWRIGLPGWGGPARWEVVAEAAPGPVLLMDPLLLALRPRDAIEGFAGIGLVEGWGEPEAWGRWALARAATVRVDVPPGRASLVLRVAPPPGFAIAQQVTIRAGGRVLRTLRIEGAAWDWRDVRVLLPGSEASRELEVGFEFGSVGRSGPEDPIERALPFAGLRVEVDRSASVR